MTHVLVTGGAGFIGTHLVRRLVARGDRVSVLDDLSWGSAGNIEGLPGVELLKGSVLQAPELLGRLRGVSQVFHLAALISSHDSLTEPDAYVQTNVLGLERVVRLCRHLERPRLIFASSSTVYGIGSTALRHETDPPRPANVYALTKLAGEHVLDIYREQAGYDDVSLRLFNVYGPVQNPKHPYANVTCKFSRAAALGEPVRLYGDGRQTRDFIYVDDVVNALLAVADRPTHDRIYNVGTGKAASIAMLLELVQKVSGSRLEIERCPAWANDIREIRADVSRLSGETGWQATVSLEDGLARTVEYFRTSAS